MQQRIERKDGKTYLVTRKGKLSEFWREISEDQIPEEPLEPEKAETAPVEIPVKPARKKAG